jgi:hypothetical protein
VFFVAQVQSSNSKKQPVEPKDRLGQAVVSLITGIFSIIFFLAVPNMNAEQEAGIPLLLLSILLAFIGFILGVRERKSPKGRGMAIAGMTKE